jgi:hypothetical protein
VRWFCIGAVARILEFFNVPEKELFQKEEIEEVRSLMDYV